MRQNSNRNDVTNCSTNNASSGKKQRDRSADPDGHKQCNGPICPTYDEERSDPRWKRMLEESLPSEPVCGHAIDYLRTNTGTTIATGSAASYCSSLSIFIDFLHERGVNVCEADIRDVREYFNMRVRQNRSENRLSGDRTAIANLYKHIELYREADTTLSHTLIREEIKPSAFRTKERFEREPLTKKEVKKLFDAVDKPRNRLIIQVAVELGPRNVDICKLKTSDVNLDEKKVTLTNTKAGGTYTLPISNGLSLLLRRWIEVERWAMGVVQDNPYLFPSHSGGSLSQSRVRCIVSQAAERAGIQEVVGEIPITKNQKESMNIKQDVRKVYRVDVHTLRHTFNQLLIEAGVPRDARSAALDHSSTDVTKEFYDHQESNYQELLKQLFDGVLGSQL